VSSATRAQVSEHDGAGGASDGRLEVSLDADAARDLFEAFLRFLSRGTHSDRDPSRDGFGDQDFLAGLTGLVGLDGDKLDDLLGHGTHALGPFAAEHWV
jgi:hypothetical protein